MALKVRWSGNGLIESPVDARGSAWSGLPAQNHTLAYATHARNLPTKASASPSPKARRARKQCRTVPDAAACRCNALTLGERRSVPLPSLPPCPQGIQATEAINPSRYWEGGGGTGGRPDKTFSSMGQSLRQGQCLGASWLLTRLGRRRRPLGYALGARALPEAGSTFVQRCGDRCYLPERSVLAREREMRAEPHIHISGAAMEDWDCLFLLFCWFN